MVLHHLVDQIKVILPSEVEALYVTEGRDMITLMTCTPYTVNTHRLLVRGTRVENDKTDSEEEQNEEKQPSEKVIRSVSTSNNYLYFLGYKVSYLAAILGIAGFLIAVTVTVVLLIHRNKRRSQRDNES